MKQILVSFAARLTSRKFLMAVLAAAYFFSIHDLDSVRYVVMTYLGAEGLSDAAARFSLTPPADPIVVPTTTTERLPGTADEPSNLSVVPGDVPL